MSHNDKEDEQDLECILLNEEDTIDNFCDGENDEEQQLITTFQNTAQSFVSIGKFNSTLVRCAAHTLQLAVDVLKNEFPCITNARRVSKKLRTSSFLLLMKKMNYKKPILDGKISGAKQFCIDLAHSNKELHLLTGYWNSIEQITKSLKPANNATIALQKDQLVPGYFFQLWWKCVLLTRKVDSPMSRKLYTAMKIRQCDLMKNDAFLSALYLDPRYQSVLSNEEKTTAQAHLEKPWRCLQQIQIQEHAINSSNLDYSFNSASSRSSSTTSSNDDEFEKIKSSNTTNKIADVNEKFEIEKIIKDFDSVDRIPYTFNVLDYWKQHQFQHPELYKLAMIVLAVPSTEVSVEMFLCPPLHVVRFKDTYD